MTTSKTVKRSARKSSSSASRQTLRSEWKASLIVWSAPKGKTFRHPRKSTLIGKSEAKKEYKLDDDDLDSIPVEDKVDKNKISKMVFDLGDVQELARRKYEKLGMELPEALMDVQEEEDQEGEAEAEAEAEEEMETNVESEAGVENQMEDGSEAVETETVAEEMATPSSSSKKVKSTRKKPSTDEPKPLRSGRLRSQFRAWLTKEWRSPSRGHFSGKLIQKTEAKNAYKLSEGELDCIPSQEKMEPKRIRGRQEYIRTVVFSLRDVKDVAKKKCEMLGAELPTALQP